MITIGQKLNSSMPDMREAMLRDDQVVHWAKMQERAHFLDINTAVMDDEEGAMKRCIQLVEQHTNCGVCIDSPSVEVLQAGLNSAQKNCIVNSLNKGNCDLLIGDILKRKSRTKVIVHHTETELVDELLSSGVEVLVDISLRPLAVDDTSARDALLRIDEIKKKYPQTGILCGLSNISFGLPQPQRLCAAFLTLAMQQGLTAAILDICNEDILFALGCAHLLRGTDECCLGYLNNVT